MTWHQEYAGPETIQSLYAVDDGHAWAVGESALLRTQDGGKTWKTLGEPANPVRLVYLVDLQSGVAIAGDDPASAGALYRTGDGGVTWTHLDTPEPVVSACLSDSQLIYVVGVPPVGPNENLPGLDALVSHDGGQTWRKALSIPSTALLSGGGGTGLGAPVWGQLRCAGQSDVWFLALGLAAHLGVRPYILYRSTDVGEHWQRLLLGIDPATMSPTSFDVVSSRTAFVGGDCGACPGADQLRMLLVTVDSGATWSQSPLPTGLSGSTTSEFSLSFADDKRGRIAVSKQENFQPAGEIWMTPDGGHTWQQQYPKPAP